MTSKLIIILTTVLSFPIASAQIVIGEVEEVGQSTLLDFESSPGNVRGIILPAVDVTELPSNPTPANGTFVFDTSDNTVKAFYLNDQGIEAWHDLTGFEGPGEFDAGILDHLDGTNDIGEGTVIGNPSSSVEGVLVLESTEKAMVLPKVASPHINVKSPYPGMMCYDTITKSLAVFDGSKWYFWK